MRNWPEFDTQQIWRAENSIMCAILIWISLWKGLLSFSFSFTQINPKWTKILAQLPIKIDKWKVVALRLTACTVVFPRTFQMVLNLKWRIFMSLEFLFFFLTTGLSVNVNLFNPQALIYVYPSGCSVKLLTSIKMARSSLKVANLHFSLPIERSRRPLEQMWLWY